MYISAQVTPNMKEVLVWERTKAGRVTKRYPAPYYFYVQDEDGEYSDIHDNKLRRLDFADYNSFKEKRDRYLNFGEKVYESDIAVDQKILSEYYYGKENTVDSHISFFDIEVDYDKEQGFSSPQNPYAPINAISLFHFWSQKSYMLLVSPHLSQWNPGPEWTVDMLSPETRAMADIQFFESEEELLLKFFELIQDTDIIVGWNSEGFDVPYVYERCLRLWGDRAKKLWCFDEAKEPRYKEVEGKFGQIDQVLEIFGREHVDYLKAFQKFEMSMRPSYTLDAISEEILPELKKLDYEGTLYSLYRNDFEHFVRYGIRDSECLDGFEKKLGYIRLAVQMTHGSTTHLKNVMGTLKVVENAIINFCHYEMNKIVPDSKKEVDMSMGKFTGAVVLKPRVGMHERVAALDVNSLYPSAIRTVNISPEKIVGQFFENHRAYEEIFAKSSAELYFRTEDGEVEIKTAAEWYDYFREQNFTLSGYGTVFNQDSQGFLPTILAMWYKLRKEYQATAKEWKAKAKELPKGSKEYNEANTKFEYYYRLQYVYKILLNSAYGALGNKYFKFFDIRLAESTTRSGREVLMHMIAFIAQLMDGVYSPPEKQIVDGDTWFIPSSECIVYGDTDSCYFKTYAESVEDAKKICALVEKKTNASFSGFCKEAFNSDNNVIKAGLDLISSRSIFIKPKMYIMHLDYFEDNDVDKMKVMGLQIKKTNIPKPIAIKLTKFIERLLKGDDWRTIQEEIVEYKEEILESKDIMDMGLPKGIKGIEDYTDRWKRKEPDLRLPGHVSASIFYNTCLEHYGDKESQKIVSGSKIKTFYLTEKFGQFKSIALPTDTKKLPPWFSEHFEHLIDRDAQGLRLIDSPLKHILGAIGERIPTRKSLLFDSLVEY